MQGPRHRVTELKPNAIASAWRCTEAALGPPLPCSTGRGCGVHWQPQSGAQTNCPSTASAREEACEQMDVVPADTARGDCPPHSAVLCVAFAWPLLLHRVRDPRTHEKTLMSQVVLDADSGSSLTYPHFDVGPKKGHERGPGGSCLWLRRDLAAPARCLRRPRHNSVGPPSA